MLRDLRSYVQEIIKDREEELKGGRLSIILLYGHMDTLLSKHKPGVLSTVSPMEIAATR
jgi:hypothetical protein